MFERLLSDVLLRYLGEYVEGVSSEQISVAVWKGDLVLENLSIKRDALAKLLHLPFYISRGIIRRIIIKVPWSRLKSEPATIILDRVFIVAKSKTRDQFGEEDRELFLWKKLAQASSVENATRKSDADDPNVEDHEKSETSFLRRLAERVVDNLQLEIANVHIRFEDQTSDPKNPYALGLTVEEVSLISTNDSWKPIFVQDRHNLRYKLGSLRKFGWYIDTNPKVYNNVREISPEWWDTHFSLNSGQQPQNTFVLQPMNATLKVLMNIGAMDQTQPMLNMKLEVEDVLVDLEHVQYQSLLKFVAYLSNYEYLMRHGKNRPRTSVLRNPSAWWRYAILCVRKDISRRHFSWEKLKKRKARKKEYVDLHKQLKAPPWEKKLRNDELVVKKRRHRELERKLSVYDLVMFRSWAELELKEEAARYEAQQKTWARYLPMLTLGGVQVTEREKQELYQQIDFDPLAEQTEDSRILRTLLETKVSSVRVNVRSKRSSSRGPALPFAELELTKARLLIGLRVRSMFLKANVRGMRIRDNSPAASHFPDVVRRYAETDKGIPFIKLLYESQPIDTDSDVRLKISISALDIVYNPTFVAEVQSFFKNQTADLEIMETDTKQRLQRLAAKSKAEWKEALRSRKVIDVTMNVSAPKVLFPIDPSKPEAPCLAVDLGTLSITSEAAGSRNQSTIDTFRIQLGDVQSFIGTKYDVGKGGFAGRVDTVMHKFSVDFEVKRALTSDGDVKTSVDGRLGHLQFVASPNRYNAIVAVLNRMKNSPQPPEIAQTRPEQQGALASVSKIGSLLYQEDDFVRSVVFVIRGFEVVILSRNRNGRIREWKSMELAGAYVKLRSKTVMIGGKEMMQFIIGNLSKTFTLLCLTAKEATEWVQSLQSCIDEAALKHTADGGGFESALSGDMNLSGQSTNAKHELDFRFVLERTTVDLRADDGDVRSNPRGRSVLSVTLEDACVAMSYNIASMSAEMEVRRVFARNAIESEYHNGSLLVAPSTQEESDSKQASSSSSKAVKMTYSLTFASKLGDVDAETSHPHKVVVVVKPLAIFLEKSWLSALYTLSGKLDGFHTRHQESIANELSEAVSFSGEDSNVRIAELTGRSVDIEFQVESLQLSLCPDKDSPFSAEFALSEFLAKYRRKNQWQKFSGKLKNMFVNDTTGTGSSNKIFREIVGLRSPEGSSGIEFYYESNTSSSCADGLLWARLSSIRLVYLHKFFTSLTAYFKHDVAVEKAMEVAGDRLTEETTQLMTQTRGRMEVDVIAESPMLIIPQSSTTSNVLVGDLGTITYTKHYLLGDGGRSRSGSEVGISERLVIGMGGMNVTSGHWGYQNPDSSTYIVKETDLEIVVESSAESERDIQCHMKGIDVELTEMQYRLILRCIDENLNERPYSRRAVIPSDDKGGGNASSSNISSVLLRSPSLFRMSLDFSSVMSPLRPSVRLTPSRKATFNTRDSLALFGMPFTVDSDTTLLPHTPRNGPAHHSGEDASDTPATARGVVKMNVTIEFVKLTIKKSSALSIFSTPPIYREKGAGGTVPPVLSMSTATDPTGKHHVVNETMLATFAVESLDLQACWQSSTVTMSAACKTMNLTDQREDSKSHFRTVLSHAPPDSSTFAVRFGYNINESGDVESTLQLNFPRAMVLADFIVDVVDFFLPPRHTDGSVKHLVSSASGDLRISGLHLAQSSIHLSEKRRIIAEGSSEEGKKCEVVYDGGGNKLIFPEWTRGSHPVVYISPNVRLRFRNVTLVYDGDTIEPFCLLSQSASYLCLASDGVRFSRSEEVQTEPKKGASVFSSKFTLSINQGELFVLEDPTESHTSTVAVAGSATFVRSTNSLESCTELSLKHLSAHADNITAQDSNILAISRLTDILKPVDFTFRNVTDGQGGQQIDVTVADVRFDLSVQIAHLIWTVIGKCMEAFNSPPAPVEVDEETAVAGASQQRYQLGLSIHTGQFRVKFIEAFGDSVIPLIDAKIGQISSVSNAEDPEQSVNFTVTVNHYNLNVGCWEPLVEPWKASLQIQKPTAPPSSPLSRKESVQAVDEGLLLHPPEEAVTLTSDEIVNINVTPALLSSCRQVVMRWSDAKVRQADSFMPYMVKNASGDEVSMWLEATYKFGRGRQLQIQTHNGEYLTFPPNSEAGPVKGSLDPQDAETLFVEELGGKYAFRGSGGRYLTALSDGQPLTAAPSRFVGDGGRRSSSNTGPQSEQLFDLTLPKGLYRNALMRTVRGTAVYYSPQQHQVFVEGTSMSSGERLDILWRKFHIVMGAYGHSLKRPELFKSLPLDQGSSKSDEMQLGETMKIRSGGSCRFEFLSSNCASNSEGPLRFASVKLDRHQLTGTKDTHGVRVLRQLPIDRVGSIPIFLDAKSTFLVWEVLVKSGTKIATLKSSVAVYNNLSVTVDVMVEWESQSYELGKLAPSTELAVPCFMASSGEVRIKPEGYAWTTRDKAIILSDRSSRQICVSAMAGGASATFDEKTATSLRPEFRCYVDVQADKVDGTKLCYLRLSLEPLCVISNLLPCVTKYRLTSVRGTKDVTYIDALKPAEEHQVFFVDMYADLLMQIHIPGKWHESREAVIYSAGVSELDDCVQLVDEHDNVHRYVVDNSVLPCGTRRVSLYATHWLCNTLGLPLDYREVGPSRSLLHESKQDDRLFSPRNGDWEGEGDFETGRPYPVTLKPKSKLMVSVKRKGVSSAFPADAVDTIRLEVEQNDGGRLREYQLGVSFKVAPGPFFRSKLVTIAPLVVVWNKFSWPLKYKQENGDVVGVVGMGELQPFHWPNVHKKKILHVTFEGDQWEWSGGMSLDSVETFRMRVSRKDKLDFVIMRVDIKQTDATAYVIFQEEELHPPFRLENMTFEPIYYRQQGVPHSEWLLLLPQGRQLFAWDEPSKTQKLEVKIRDKKHSYELRTDVIVCHPHPHRLFGDRSLSHDRAHVYFSVKSEGPTRVVAFTYDKGALQSEEEYATPHLSLRVVLPGAGFSVIDSDPQEVLYAYIEQPIALFSSSSAFKRVEIGAKDVQIDSQLPNVKYSTLLSSASSLDHDRPLLHLSCVHRLCGEELRDSATVLSHVSLSLQNVDVKIEDAVIAKVAEIFAGPVPTKSDDESLEVTSVEKQIQKLDASAKGNELYIERLIIHPFTLKLSLHTSPAGVKGRVLSHFTSAMSSTLFNIDDASLHLHHLVLSDTSGSLPELSQRILHHYSHEVLKKLLSIVGSVELLGNPMGLLKNVGTGAFDFVREPMHAILYQPSDLGPSISRGSQSLVKNSIYGTFNTASKVTGTLGKLTTALSFDNNYIQERARLTNQHPRHVGEGLWQGLEQGFKGVVQGVTGVVNQPTRGLANEGLKGFVKGIAKGGLGVVSKPVTGVLDLLSKTTEGVRNTMSFLDSSQKSRCRFPRYIGPDRVLTVYSPEKSMGQQLLREIDGGKYAKEVYLSHAEFDSVIAILTPDRLLCISTADSEVEWEVELSKIRSHRLFVGEISLVVVPRHQDSVTQRSLRSNEQQILHRMYQDLRSAIEIASL